MTALENILELNNKVSKQTKLHLFFIVNKILSKVACRNELVQNRGKNLFWIHQWIGAMLYSAKNGLIVIKSNLGKQKNFTTK